MAITITPTGELVVLDETDGLQNATATASPAGDADDNDFGGVVPTALSSRLTFYGVAPDEAALSGYSGAAGDTGDNILNVTGATLDSDFALTGEGGAAFPDYGAGTSSFSSGLFALDDATGTTTEIFLFTDPTNNNIVYGVAGDGGTDPIVFAVYLDEVKTSGITTGTKLWTALADGYTLAHNTDGTTVTDHDDSLDLTNKLFVAAVGEDSFSFEKAPSGQNLFMMFGNTSLAILVTGEDPANESAGQQVSNDGDTVNTGQGGGATTLGTEGQQIKAQKAMVVTFVTGADSQFLVPDLTPGEATDETSIAFTGYAEHVRGASITISQMTPGGSTTTATVELAAYFTTDAAGDSYINDDPLVTGDTEINITDVNVIRAGVDVTGTLSVNYDGNTAVITGVKDDDIIEYTTDADHNRVLVRNDQPEKGSGSNVSFDLGGFTITQVSSDVEEVGSKVKFEDDGPTVTVEDLDGTFTDAVQTGGIWDHTNSEDDLNSLNVNFDGYQIDAHPAVVVDAALTKTGGFTFDGSITDDFNGDNVDETVPFTLIFNPDTDAYTFQMENPPTTIIQRDSTQGALKAGGPDPVQTLLFGGSETGADDVVFFGAVATAPQSGVAGDPPPNDLLDLIVTGATDLNEDQIQAFLSPTNQIPTLINADTKMNVSTAGIGINNNNLDGNGTLGIQAGDESFVFNPEEVVDKVRVYIDNSVGGYSPPAEQLYYTIYYTDGTISSNNLVSAADLQNAPRKDPTVPDVAEGGKFFEIDGGTKQIDAIQLTMGAGTVKIPVIQWTIEQEFNPEPLHLDFTASLFDGDGDSDEDAFAIDLADATV
ncbi:hypothetical protein SAMN02927900_04005 [Rhizobium mongolense subsp. loessense]|uniref:DUF5801 domain-containing protein n=1 Tax=Rhizobium mongolense subsp. loessense TaxID=158890 RepID=A0A1G4SP36_9HYPH|nr:hypothetical protein [Rhizobium mongolense]SCW70707.1 hypothetical protein SAMN02927900_04005 [Rhizobium mongolense subsp. loessense]